MLRFRRLGLGFLLAVLAACGTPVDQRPTPNLVVNITPAPTEDLAATVTAFAEETVPTEQPEGVYFVREGDTLESIALAFNTTIDAITMTNGISDANVIQIGQPLVIPSLISPTEELTGSVNPSEVLPPSP